MTVKCPNCGKKNNWTESICKKCGTLLNGSYSDPYGASQPGNWQATPSGTPFQPSGQPNQAQGGQPQANQTYQQPYYYQSGVVPPKKGLSGGAVLGIVLGCAAIGMVVLAGAMSLLRPLSRQSFGEKAEEGSRPSIQSQEEPKAKKVDLRALYGQAGGLSDEALAPAAAAFFKKPASDINYEELSLVRYLEIDNMPWDPGRMDWVDSYEQVYVRLSTHSREEFATEAEFRDTVFEYRAETENSYALRFPDIQYFSGLAELNLKAGRVMEQEYLNLPGLKRLNVSLREDVGSLSALPLLEELTVSDLRDLSGLGELSLKRLSLLDGGAEDYGALADMAGLECLELEDCDQLVDLSFLRSLTGLRELSLTDLEKVEDYSPVGELSGLKSLKIAGTELKRVQFLEKLGGLTSFTCLDNSRLKELPELASCTQLETLVLDASGFTGPLPLSGMQALTRLELSYAQDLSTLGSLAALRDLTLTYCSGDYSSLEKLAGLQRLSVTTSSMGGSDGMRFLTSLTELRELDLSGSQLYNMMDYIGGLTKLESLDISDATVGGDYTQLQHLSGLKKLNLDEAEFIRNVTIDGYGGMYSIGYDDIPLRTMTAVVGQMDSLNWLSMRGLELDSLDFVAGLEQLEYLDVSDNYITDLSPAQGLPALTVLLAGDNPVASGTGEGTVSGPSEAEDSGSAD